MDRGAWKATVHGAAKSWTQLATNTHTHTHTHTHTGMTDYNSVSKRIVPVTGSLALNLTCLVTLTHV